MSREEIRGMIEEQTGIDLVEESDNETLEMSEDCDCDKFKEPCQNGYEMIGMKMKGGRLVPNCVPQKMSNDLAKIEQDGKPLFDTKEEAERVAKELGCSGSHEHIIDGVTWYMPCSEHSDLTDELLEGFNAITKFDTYNDYADRS